MTGTFTPPGLTVADGLPPPLKRLVQVGLLAMLAACATRPAPTPDSSHMSRKDVPQEAAVEAARIPAPVQTPAMPPPPTPTRKAETYSVVVSNMKVQELLFALARDARVNIDVHSGIEGTVTLNAIDQTLPQILDRIARQVDMRWEMEGPNLAVMPDTPFLRTYKVDYVNMSRDTTETVAVTTQIGSTGGSGVPGATGTTNASGTLGNNNSQTRIENKSNNRFWDTLIQNVKDLLRETDKVFPEGSSETVTEEAKAQSTSGIGTVLQNLGRNVQANLAASPNPATMQNQGTTVVRHATFREAASVIANPETGVLSIRATSRQHAKIQEFLDRVTTRARRQALIEATVVEVQLNNNYQQGIDWSRLALGGTGFKFVLGAAGTLAAPAASIFQLGYTNPDSRVGNISATAKLLESFGNVKVLSSPKLSVLNNQTAVLKVVDNSVYFTIDTNTNQNQTQTVTTFTTTVHSVPVGFVMNVTPQISDDGTVLLNIRPSISRIIGTATDPNPALKDRGIVNEIPVIRSREMESMLRIEDGNIAVMGGLMEDLLDLSDDTVPGLSRIPAAGALFQNRNDTTRKTELVIFLRPVVIRDASVDGDYRAYRDKLPGDDFFADNPGPGAWGPGPNHGGGSGQ